MPAPRLPRPSTEQARLGLKAAVRGAVTLAGGAASFTLETRLGASSLSDAANPAREMDHLPLDVALDADLAAGAPVIAAALAQAQGWVLVRAAEGDAAGLTVAHLAALTRETGEAISAAATALQGGEAERRTALKEIHDAIHALAAAAARLAGRG